MIASGIGLWLAAASFLQAAVPPPRDGALIARTLRAELHALLEKEANELEAVAAGLEAAGHADQAKAVRVKIVPPIDGADARMRFSPLPEYVPGPGAGLANRPASATVIPEDAAKARSTTAKALFELAAKAAQPENERFDVASLSLREVLARDPNHREARRLLGYLPHEGGWATAQAAKNLKDGMVLDPVFGWVPSDWVPHLKRGELPGKAPRGRPVPWLTTEAADAQRDRIDRGWEIATEHFDIRTDVPLSEAIAFGRKLEALHDAFYVLFADLIGDEHPLARRYRNPKSTADTRSARRHTVYYFSTKAEYVEYLTPREGPTIEQSLGLYLPPKKGQKGAKGTSYFFRDPEGQIDDLSTLFHEASHQLLFESSAATRQDANLGHYWVWEGLGTYFETFTPQPDGSYTIGGLVGPRIAKAHDDCITRGLFIPTATLTSLDKSRFNDDRDVYLHYAESMALVVFLMHADHALYRDDFLDYVADAYRGRFRRAGNGRPLSERLGITPKSLDERFLRFLATAKPAP